MRPERFYLDHNATTPIHPAALQAAMEALSLSGNPSSIHAEGRQARAVIETARRQVAGLVGATPDDVIFTSGGTEGLNIALSPAFGACDVLLIGAGEHAAVRSGHRFPPERVERVGLTPNGVLDLEALAAGLQRHAGRRVMLALQAANNETGAIQPVTEAAAKVRDHGGVTVCDAVQAVGKIVCDVRELGADAVVVSAHKFGGPKGVGALIFAPSAPHLSEGVVRGGGQERGLRSGTENIGGIAGFGAAAGWLREHGLDTGRLIVWRDAIERAVLRLAPEAVVFGSTSERLPNTLCFVVPGLTAQVLLMSMDLAGVAVSAGSACSSGKVTPSHVLEAMGVPPALAGGAIRVSLGWTTTDEDVAAFEAGFAEALRLMQPRAAHAA